MDEDTLRAIMREEISRGVTEIREEIREARRLIMEVQDYALTIGARVRRLEERRT
jgi:hypothetical protein